MCHDLLKQIIFNDPDFLKKCYYLWWIWIFKYDVETKHQNEKWFTTNLTPPKKAKMSKSKIKTTFIFFLWYIIHKKFLPIEQSTSLVRNSRTAVEKSCPCETSYCEYLPGCCILTMHFVTKHSWLMNFWQRKVFQFSSPIIYLSWVAMTLSLSDIEKASRRTPLWDNKQH